MGITERDLPVQDPPEYFRPKGGLLSFDMHLHDLVEQSAPHQQVLHSVDHSQAVPRQRTMKLDEDKTGHFNLVNAQIQQASPDLLMAWLTSPQHT